jgi:hypothetical protein
MQVKIEINRRVVYRGDIEEMPEYGDYVDIYEEAVNRGMESGKTLNGWEWEVA